ncbi:TPA: glycosyltransferase family 2 protein, partial [Escherichia coli]|nr:glycosyltransferase family 2 protein [Escherichia coli]
MKIVSFVIPLYNTEKYIVDCIDSILEQKAIDLTFIEIIVVDDGSTDNSLSVLEKYNENESITIIKKSNSGISLTRNLGVERAKGDYIFFLDSDDKIAPGSLAKIFNTLNKGNIDILFFAGSVFYDIDTTNSFMPIYERARQTCNSIMSSSDFFIKSI